MSPRKKKKVDKDKVKDKDKVESELKVNDEEHEESSECEDSCEEESDESSEEQMIFDQLSDEYSSSDNDDWIPSVSPQKTKRSCLSSASPSPAKCNGSASPASVHGDKKSKKRKSFRRSLSSSSDDKWRSADEPDVDLTQPVFRPCRTPGPQLVSTASYSPLQCFELFFSSSVMLKIVSHSNIYGAKCHAARKQKWQNFSLKDFKSFLALVIYMGLLKCFNFRDYWKKSDIYSLPYPVQVMSCRKFLAINSALHLSHPDEDAKNEKKKGTAEYDRLFKIKPLYDDIRGACKTFFHPFQNIFIDERMVATKGRNGLKQYMKNKPMNSDYKLFVLADSLSGYTWDFFIYEGNPAADQNEEVGHAPVMALVNEKSLGYGYKLYMDNTSPKLFNDLLDKKIWACGTIQANSIKHSRTPGPRGNIRWFRDDKLLFVEWKDRRDVLMCSTFHKAFNGDTVKRKVKGHDGVWTEEEFPVPPAVLDYNKYMGGVDLSDALIGYYTVLHKTRRWYRSFFYHFVDIAVVNAFILHQHMATEKKQKPMTQKAFREALVSELAGTGPFSAPEPLDTSTMNPENSSTDHMPTYLCSNATNGRRQCKLCHSKTPIKCVACDVSLCFVAKRHCFNLWHTVGAFKQ